MSKVRSGVMHDSRWGVPGTLLVDYIRPDQTKSRYPLAHVPLGLVADLRFFLHLALGDAWAVKSSSAEQRRTTRALARRLMAYADIQIKNEVELNRQLRSFLLILAAPEKKEPIRSATHLRQQKFIAFFNEMANLPVRRVRSH